MKTGIEVRAQLVPPISRKAMAVFISLGLSTAFMPKDWNWPRLLVAVAMLVWTVSVIIRAYAHGIRALLRAPRETRQTRD